MACIYKNLKHISSLKGWIKVIEVLYDGRGNPVYSLALIKWKGVIKIGIRWNIAEVEWYDIKKQKGQAKCKGNLQSKGHFTWFVYGMILCFIKLKMYRPSAF